MKILQAQQLREADAYTIANEPIASVDLMERAATAVFNRIFSKLSRSQSIHIFVGMGNNGGDGLVLARLMLQQALNVSVWIVRFTEKSSPDFDINLSRLQQVSNNVINNISDNANFPEFESNDLIVDAIFGSGLNKAVSDFPAKLINHINNQSNVVIAIDIPSGLFADQAVGAQGAVIKADYTYTFETLKLAFLFPENEFFIGQWEVVPIGLHADFINKLSVKNNLLEVDLIRSLLRSRPKFAHKGTFGHALLIAGSSGKSGAAILAAEACLRSGAGLLHVHLPQSIVLPIQISVPEAMISEDVEKKHFSQVPKLEKYNAIGAGPGLGMHSDSANALKVLIQNANGPMVLDADALNILAENPTWMAFLPAGSILTPHPKEFERLAGKWLNSFERLEMQRELSVRHNIYVIVKGAHTSITTPLGECWFNSTGNPGMATAGSGDVLTGIILGLLAQHYTPFGAALLGVYLHGLAGDIAAKQFGHESMLARDIIAKLSEAFKLLSD